MTSPRSALILAMAAALAAVAAPSAGLAATKGCKIPKRATVQDQNRYAVVYSVGQFEDEVVSACYFKTGKTTRIATTFSLRLAGALVANEQTDDPGPAGTDDGRGVEVTDLKTGKTLFSNFFDADDDNIDISITDLELTKTGTVSIIAKGDAAKEFPGGTAVMTAKKGAKQFTVLDSGAAIVPDSLAISGKFVFWMNGTTPKSASSA